MSSKTIAILTTGGTIEKTYDERDGSLANRRSQLEPSILKHLRLPHTDYFVEEIMSKDSLFMTDADRDLICGRIQHWEEAGHPVVVIHGTDSMVETAQLCSKKLTLVKHPIVFTGAMKPVGFDDSDARQKTWPRVYSLRNF